VHKKQVIVFLTTQKIVTFGGTVYKHKVPNIKILQLLLAIQIDRSKEIN